MGWRMTKDKVKNRASSRRWYWKHIKGGATPPEEIANYEIDAYSYRIVPNRWRELAQYRERRALQEIDSPLVRDLMRGKTLFVDYETDTRRSSPYRTLYNYFLARGYRFRVHIVDDTANEKYRRLLMWIEPVRPVKFVEEEKVA